MTIKDNHAFPETPTLDGIREDTLHTMLRSTHGIQEKRKPEISTEGVRKLANIVRAVKERIAKRPISTADSDGSPKSMARSPP